MPEQSLPGAVFLSYASEDAEAAARICEALRAAGVEVWLDKSELRGGDAWDAKIKKHIHDCAIFIPVISAHTNARAEGYFRREWRQATRRLQDMADDVAFLVPVVIDQTREADARVPEEFLRAQWTWLPGGEPPPEFAQRVRHLLGADSATVDTQSAVVAKIEPNARVKHARNHRVPPVRLVIPAVIALLVLGAGAFWFFQSARDAPAAKPVPATDSPKETAAPNEKSIAVLPFINMSSDKEQEYFSDGLSEELLNLLAKVPDLRVAARTSSFYYKGKDVKLTDVARDLRVAHLLEGSVRKSGNRVRITTQLIRASDGYHQWSETYDRTLEDIFAVQEEIAAAVVSQLKIILLGATPTVRKTRPEAYTLYLQAAQLSRQVEWPCAECIALYQKTLAIDPNYTPALIGLAWHYAGEANWGFRPLTAGMDEARVLVSKALVVDSEYAPAHALLGYIAQQYDQDLAAAAHHFKRALALDPHDTDILVNASYFSGTLGRLDSLVPLGEYLVRRDPLDAQTHILLAYIDLYAGRLEESMTSSRTALKLSPGMSASHTQIGDALLLKGDYRAALTEYGKDPLEATRLTGLAMAHYAMGNASKSDAALAELIEKHEDWAYAIASVFAYQGKSDHAFEWLEKAVANRDSSLNSLPIDLFLRILNDDPRWLPFLRKLGKAPEQLAAIKFELKVPQH